MLKLTMLHLSAFVTLFSFFMWIQPLGAFIAPAQEDTACGGLRAFHMCSMEWGKGRDRIQGSKTSFTAASSTEKTKNSGSSGGNHLSCSDCVPSDPGLSRFQKDVLTLAPPTSLFLSAIDPIPKI